MRSALAQHLFQAEGIVFELTEDAPRAAGTNDCAARWTALFMILREACIRTLPPSLMMSAIIQAENSMAATPEIRSTQPTYSKRMYIERFAYLLPPSLTKATSARPPKFS